MDSITQATLGAAVGHVLLGRKWGKKAALVGAFVGTIPDLDVIILPFFNELQKVSIHRGLSHSILFCFVMGFIIAYFLSRLKWTKGTKFYHIYSLSFFGLFTHVILDTFTTYGTQLFRPFSDERVSWDSIGIIDPIYTIPLLIGLLWSIFLLKPNSKYKSLPNKIGLGVSTLYLIFTLIHKQRIENIFDDQLVHNDISYQELLTVPVAIGNIKWYGVARDDSNLYIGKYSSWKMNEIQFHSFPINDYLLDGLDPYLVDRMKWFAQGFYTVAEKSGKIRVYNMQCDMQGVRTYGDYRAPTAFYYEIEPIDSNDYKLTSGMHPKNN